MGDDQGYEPVPTNSAHPTEIDLNRAYTKGEKRELCTDWFSERDARAPSFCVSSAKNQSDKPGGSGSCAGTVLRSLKLDANLCTGFATEAQSHRGFQVFL